MFVENQIFHIYNHANGRENFFNTDLERMIFDSGASKYLAHWANMLAFCFEKNHFHLVIKLKSKEEIEKAIRIAANNKYGICNEIQIQTYVDKHKDIESFVRQMLSNFFNSFAKKYNLIHSRKGCLFRKSFQIKLVDSANYLSHLIFYVHANPVKDGFRRRMEDWDWSSYNSFFTNSIDPFLDKEFVINHFGGLENFKKYHEQKIIELIEKKEQEASLISFLKDFKIFNLRIPQ